VLFVSATPSDFEKQESEHITELINRPTGLLDPLIEVKPAKTEIETLFDEITKEIAKKGKVLVSSLTKKMAEDLTDFFNERGIRSKYLHSDIDSLERLKIIMDLRKNIFDVLVGVNLLREGLDIPEVSLVAILDADKQGFLRSESSLIQTIGRAARNKNGRAILFGNTIKPNMLFAINETIRRRKIQENFNKKNGIIPTTINGKTILNIEDFIPGKEKKNKRKLSKKIIRKKITELEKEMKKAAKEWDFEYAAILRDKIFEYKSTIKE
jgi:excinuclease ABC subunit B